MLSPWLSEPRSASPPRELIFWGAEMGKPKPFQPGMVSHTGPGLQQKYMEKDDTWVHRIPQRDFPAELGCWPLRCREGMRWGVNAQFC